MKKLSEIAKAIVPPFESCENCYNGWITVPVKGGRAMARCPCWKAHQQRIAQASTSAETRE